MSGLSGQAAHDAAFGPQGPASGVPEGFGNTVPQPEPLFVELQNLLNAKGYGPVAVTGLDSPDFVDAIKRFRAAIGKPWAGGAGDVLNLQEVLQQLKAAGVAPPGTVAPPTVGIMQGAAASNQPFWKHPKFIWGALAVAGVVGYIAYRTGKLDDTLSGLGLSGSDEPEKPRRAHRRVKPSEPTSEPTKCSRLPDVDFADAVPLAVPVSE